MHYKNAFKERNDHIWSRSTATNMASYPFDYGRTVVQSVEYPPILTLD